MDKQEVTLGSGQLYIKEFEGSIPEDTALEVEDFDKAYELHKEMGCICFENKEMGIYFIADPDNYWIEIIPKKK